MEDSSDEEVVYSFETTRDRAEKGSAIDNAGLFSFITFGWVFPYMYQCFRGTIPRGPPWVISIFDATGINTARLEHLWNEQRQKPGNKASLVAAFCLFIRTRVLVACFVFLFCLCFGFIGPTCIVRMLIEYAELHRTDMAYGLMLVAVLFIVEAVRVLFYGATWAMSYRTALRSRAGVLGLVYRKIMRIRTLRHRTVGEVINIYANDSQRIFDAVVFAPLVMMGPLVLIGGLIYLLIRIGPWSLMGLLVFVLFDVVQAFLGKWMVKYRKLAIQNTEDRVSRTTEVVNSMRLIKMSAWEPTFMDIILDIRKKEELNLWRAGYAQSLAISAGPAVPVVAAIVTFLGYIGTGHDLLASEAFSIITVFFVMVFGIRMIPYGMRYCAEALVSIRNIQKLLLQSERDGYWNLPDNRSLAIVFDKAAFAWDHDNTKAPEKPGVKGIDLVGEHEVIALEDINFAVNRKELVGVCGPVGSGKSAVLKAIVSQLVHKDGDVLVNGHIAYCAQEPWLLNASIRENIVFGARFDSDRYYKVLYVCALNRDVNEFKAGDKTLIGERGITLSGGQKSRIALARALYAPERDVYLLDNPLASLDKQVAEHVLQYAIRGFLADKTVLWVTNNADHLVVCEEVVYMSEGRVMDYGPNEQLLSRCGDYKRFIQEAKHAASIVEARMSEVQRRESESEVVAEGSAFAIEDIKKEMMELETNAEDAEENDEEEDLGLAKISAKVYWAYLRSAGSTLMIFVLFGVFVAAVASSVFCTAWLSYWIKMGHDGAAAAVANSSSNSTSLTGHMQMPMYMTIYAMSLIVAVLTSIIKAYFFTKISLSAASSLHYQLLKRMMHGWLRFFDVTPTGRIINRFSKDMDEVDVKLPFTFETCVQNGLYVIATVLVIAVVFPWFILAAVPIFAIFLLFVLCFRAGIRALKRTENNSRSPLFSHITTTLEGLATIHAFEKTPVFQQKFKNLMDDNQTATFMFQAAMRWLAVWLDLIVLLITVVTALLIVLMGDAVPPEYGGMALALAIQKRTAILNQWDRYPVTREQQSNNDVAKQCFQMSGIFQYAVRLQAELEGKMISVERIRHYIENIEQEPAWLPTGAAEPERTADWPAEGRISFRNVRLRYSPNLPLALKGVDFEVPAKEKLGIVGRSGSGKSSLGSALFRLYELEPGSVISIDGVNLNELAFHEFRDRIAAIPQDPSLFSGSLRFNLDPMHVRSDIQLWAALEKTRLKSVVAGFQKGLDTVVSEGGCNFSVGERQLICMARALLRDVRILLLDEATATLDSETDNRIQDVLRESFRDCTVLIIAHRIESIISADKILLMQDGKAVEHDRPGALLEASGSLFRRMVQNLPIADSRKLSVTLSDD